MFAVILCSGCGNPRMIDLASTASRCPRCGKSVEHSRAKIHLRSEDQGELRAAMWSLNSTPEFIKDNKPKKTSSPDPILKLQRDVEKISDPEQRLALVAEALCANTGHFTKDDIRTVFPDTFEELLKGMLELGMVFEPRAGRYQRI